MTEAKGECIHTILIGKLDGKDYLEDTAVEGR